MSKTRDTSSNRLTDRKCRSAKPGFHPDGGKLYLFVKPSGRRSAGAAAQGDGTVGELVLDAEHRKGGAPGALNASCRWMLL